MIPSNVGVCFLTAIGGNLRGDKEWVGIERDQNSAAPQVLTGGSEQNDVFAEARCVRYGKLQKQPSPPT